jgi:hypothetical protein
MTSNSLAYLKYERLGGAMSSNASQLQNWSGAPTEEVRGVRNWMPAEERTGGQPVGAEELLDRLKVPGGLTLVGLVLLGLGSLFLLPSIAYIAAGRATDGTVIKVKSRPGKHGMMYSPIVSYTVRGESFTLESSQSTSWNTYRAGDTIPVLYIPTDPEDATIGGFQHLYLIPTIFGLPGLLMTVVGVGAAGIVVRGSGWRILPA